MPIALHPLLLLGDTLQLLPREGVLAALQLAPVAAGEPAVAAHVGCRVVGVALLLLVEYHGLAVGFGVALGDRRAGHGQGDGVVYEGTGERGRNGALTRAPVCWVALHADVGESGSGLGVRFKALVETASVRCGHDVLSPFLDAADGAAGRDALPGRTHSAKTLERFLVFLVRSVFPDE